MTDYSPEAKALLERGRRALDPADDELERVRRGVASRVGAGPAAATGATATLGGLKVIVLLGVLAMGVAGSVWIVGRDGPSKVIPTAPMSPVVPSVTAEAPPSSPEAAPSAEPPPAPQTVPSADRGPSRAPSSKGNADTLLQEVALIKRAEAALAGGDASGALRLLNEHAATFPRGALTEEREATRILALCAVGRTVEARAAARRFERAAPRSMHLSRIHASCAGTEP